MGELLTGLGLSNDLAVGLTIYGVVIIAALWIAMLIWVYRDIRSRSRDTFGQLGAVVMTALLTIPGLIIYLLIRPRETLSDAYERSLEEEALLQEIEEKATCPGCGQHVKEAWQACPHCHTRLKKPCVHCRNLLELSWQVCPYCTSPQPGYSAEQVAVVTRGQARPNAVSDSSMVSPRQSVATSSSLEFVDGDEYRR
ncbi:MAG: zinc ribbon domain-containing protein [Anaerolineae bacterium]|nr:zinc ribbon domain-containing protein [Anaerolineae bacterium]